MLNATKPAMVTDHPFYPIDVQIANLVMNEMTMPWLLSIFTALCATILLVTRFVVDKVHPHLPKTEKAAIWWFVICKCPFSSATKSRVAGFADDRKIFD